MPYHGHLLSCAVRGAPVAAAADLRRCQRAGGRSSSTCARACDWDVLFVLEEHELRRAPDVEHYRLAQQLRRTLVTMDRDYLDDRRFPPEEGSGVLVISAPDERQLHRCWSSASIAALFPRGRVRSAGAAARGPQAAVAHRLGTGGARTRSMLGLNIARRRDVAVASAPARWLARGAGGRREMPVRPCSCAAADIERLIAVGEPMSSASRQSTRSRRRSARPSTRSRAISQARSCRAAPLRAQRRPSPKHGSVPRAARGTSSTSPSPSNERPASCATAAGDRRARRAASVAWLALNPVEREDYRKAGCLEAEVAGVGYRAPFDLAHQGRRPIPRTGSRQGRSHRHDGRPDARRGAQRRRRLDLRRSRHRQVSGDGRRQPGGIADPEVLVLGGIMASAADLLLEPLRTEIARRLPRRCAGAARSSPRDRRGRRRVGAARLRRPFAMIVLSGGELVLPDRILSPGTLVIEGGRIEDIRRTPSGGHHRPSPSGPQHRARL